MTVYEDFDTSQHSGAPIEGFQFVGTDATYQYTSSAQEQVINGLTFAPTTIRRDPVDSGTQEDDLLDLKITLRSDDPMVLEYAYGLAPPILDLTLYRVYLGSDFAADWIIFWKGPVAAFSVTGAVATLRVPSVFSNVLSTTVPNYFWQRSCNHVLFDSRCALSRASFKTSSTVTAFTGSHVTIANVLDPIDHLQAGELLDITTGERRHILSNIAGVLKINYPFKHMAVGDSIEATAGCDHSFTTCKDKFDNTFNYGGFPYVPDRNPIKGF